MSIASELEDLQTNVAAIQDAIVAKGGTVTGGLADLATDIEEIPSGENPLPDTLYGAALLYLNVSEEWAPNEERTMGCVVQNIDQEVFARFAEEHPLEEWMVEEGYRFRFMDGVWTLQTMGEPVSIQEEMLEETTGITVVREEEWAEMCIKYQATVDKSVPPEWVEVLNLEEYEGLSGGSGKFTVGGVERDKVQFEAFVMGTAPTSTPEWFLQDTDISAFYMGKNISLTTIGNGFLTGCKRLNSEIALPESVTSIGSSFLAYDPEFDSPLTLPSNLVSIGSSFLNGCSKFNKPVVLPASLEELGEEFMQYCSCFNHDITFPGGLVELPRGCFGYGLTSFKSKITVEEGITTIGEAVFVQIGKYDNVRTLVDEGGTSGGAEIELPASLRTIGGLFLASSTAFTKVVIPEGVTQIGYSFMEASGAVEVVIPSSVQTIGGERFLRECPFLALVEVNTTAVPPKSSYYQKYECFNVIKYRDQTNYPPSKYTGVVLRGTGASTWLATIPNTYHEKDSGNDIYRSIRSEAQY